MLQHSAEHKQSPYHQLPVTVGHTIYAFKDGGMERGLLNLVNYGDWTRFNHVIVCLTEAGGFVNQLRSPACTVIELRKKEGHDFSVPGQIAAVVHRHDINILHARGWPTLVETALASHLAGVRKTIYGFHGKTISDLHGINVLRRWVQKFAVRYYRFVVTLNNQMRYEMAAEYGLPERRIHIIPNGVATDVFCPRVDRRVLRKQLGLPTSRFIVGNVARLDPVKNHEVILRALCRLQAGKDRPYFVLVGEGFHRAVIEQEIRRLKLSTDVRLFGYSDSIPELLNCMDVYIQSSLYEGFSNTILEAMSCGLPVLATRVGGTIDVFSEGQGGYFFAPHDDDALASLIQRFEKDDSLRRVTACQARSRAVEQFSIKTMVQNYETLYGDLVVDRLGHKWQRVGLI